MPSKVRRTSSRTASATNLSKMGFATINQPQLPDKEGEKHIRKRTNSSQGLVQHQPKPFSRTTSQSKLHNKPNTKQHFEQQMTTGDGDSQTVDDDDWVSSSSAVASPAAEPDDEEEDAAIYVNSNVNSRHGHHHQQHHHEDAAPATPKRTNHALPNQRHHLSQVVSHATEHPAVVPAFHHHHATPQRHQVPTEPNHIHFAGESTDPAFRDHPLDSRIHHNGTIHHASPPPVDPVQMSSSVIHRPVNGGHSTVHGVDRIHKGDERTNRHSAAIPQQDQPDEHLARQTGTTQFLHPAVSGNGDANTHEVEGDNGRISQRGFGASRTPSQPFHDAPPPLVPLALNSSPIPRHRPSLLRRDTTPTAASRSPIETPPRSRTPPASMTHDEMVANNNKRHSVHSVGGHRRPVSLLQPSQSKRHSLSSRPGTIYGYANAHGPNNPLSLLVRLNPTQPSPLTAPPTLSPGVAHGEIDHESNYSSMSPTTSYTGRLRKRSSVASLNSVATAPVVSTTSTIAMGSSASPTSALKSSSAILSSIAHQPPKQFPTTPQSDSRPDLRRADSLQEEDGPYFVSQFSAAAGPDQGHSGSRRGKPLGRAMAGGDWTAHRTAVNHHGLLFDSFSRLSDARPDAVRIRR